MILKVFKILKCVWDVEGKLELGECIWLGCIVGELELGERIWDVKMRTGIVSIY